MGDRGGRMHPHVQKQEPMVWMPVLAAGWHRAGKFDVGWGWQCWVGNQCRCRIRYNKMCYLDNISIKIKKITYLEQMVGDNCNDNLISNCCYELQNGSVNNNWCWLFAAKWLYLTTFLNNNFLQNLSTVSQSCLCFYKLP